MYYKERQGAEGRRQKEENFSSGFRAAVKKRIGSKRVATKGRELGKKADFLLGYRFEDHWEEPIEDVRKRLELA